jgi:signal transduction histidine kinase/DNA-binding response OmpR family regulator/ligand-binding sensor domain-containing protein
MKMRFFILFLLISGMHFSIKAQWQVFTEIYSVENGLAQNSVTGCVKDEEGFMWFTTRDGLSRFDGYNFKNYKASSKELKRSISNEFQQVVKDTYGYLWLLNSMGQVFRFDPRTEIFELYPAAEENRGDNYITIRRLCLFPSDEIWMLGAGNGCIRVKTDSVNSPVEITAFCTREQEKTGHDVRSVYPDKNGKNWILTENGIAVVGREETEPSSYYLTEPESGESKNSVYAAIETYDEMLVGGSHGRLFRYDKIKRRFTVFQLPVSSALNNIISVNDSLCFISTESSGFMLLNHKTNKFSIYNRNNTAEMPSDKIDASGIDARGDIWIKLDENGNLFRFDIRKNKLYRMSLKYPQEDYFAFSPVPGSSSLSFVDDKKKIWLIPSKKEAAWYDGVSANQKPFFSSAKSITDPSIVYKTYHDTTGVFWQTTNYNGIKKCVALSSSFRFIQFHPTTEYAEINDITAFMEDDRQRLWIATRDNKIQVLDRDRKLIGYLNKKGEITKTESVFANILSIYQDRSGAVWLGANPGLFKLEPRSSSASGYMVRDFSSYSYEEPYQPLSLEVYNILEDSRGRIWLATVGAGLLLLNESEGKIQFIHKNNLFRNSYPPTVLLTKSLFEDSNGNIWVGSSEGITVFSSEFRQPEEIKFFFYNPENTDLVNSNISDIYQDKDGTMWFASFGGGLFKIAGSFYLGETPDFISYNQKNNRFPSDLVLSMREDNEGYLWIVTEDAVARFSKETGIYELFGKLNGLDHLGFSEQAILRRQSGEFIVGTGSGFYSFYPEKIKRTEFRPEIVLTRFQLFNKDIVLREKDSPLHVTINNTREITLTHKQSVFSIEYAALDYRKPAYIHYAYKLDNFEEDWNYVGTQRVASYTNLPHGTYFFRVKSTNSEGVWFDNDRVLKITILPSFWQTGWAYFLYVLAAIIVIGGSVAVFVTIYRLRSRMILDQEMSAMKLQFFTDVSHELRTPLTLINGPLENVLEGGRLARQDKEQLEVVHTNTNRMLRLMNQILDFRKIQNNKMRLKLEKTKLGEFIVACCSNFLKMAENNNIKFEVEDQTNGAFFWIDRDKMDTVMYNLLSNAFKFTPSGKGVKVCISLEDGNAVIRVEDEGCGIPKEKQTVIFDRYVTLESMSLTKQTGTGIGLSLVKEIIDLHKAVITVTSREKEGSVFEIRMKPGVGHLGDFDVKMSDEKQPDNNPLKKTTVLKESDEIPTLLIIEDNEELRSFLVSVLSKKFNIVEAPDGEAGWQKTLQEMPDFVITDIMMPVLDGISYTRRVRENEQTSHIPIILLTAKTDLDSKLECLKIGANDYITKPFSMAYLETRVENILEERKKWQDRYRNDLLRTYSSDDIRPEEIKMEPKIGQTETKDDILMKRIVDYIEKNMDNSELSVEDLLEELKMSRWNLTSKIKSLIGMTPNEFIRETRLAKAAQLIKEGEFNMTQITYMIGMTDSRYFSRCFKQKFGMTPTEYKNNSRRKDK